MKRLEFDTELEGQIAIEDLYELPERLFAVSKVFARARKEMSLAEQKTFVYALSQLKFKEEAQSNVIHLDKKTLANIIGVHSDPNHLSQDLFDEIKDISKHSYIQIADKDLDFYDSGIMITRLTFFRNKVRLKFEDEYLKLFTGLEGNYLTMWSLDVFKMTSKRSVQFYEYLRQMTDTREKDHYCGLGIRALKELFDIPKDGPGSYMRDKGGFDRANFERFVIDPLCEDLAKTKMIQLIVQPDGKYYEKVKEGSRVKGYVFRWNFTERPAVASADEVRHIQDRVDKDPQILKVAKDIIDGTPKKEPKPKNAFTCIDQHEYDFEALEKALLEKP